ncbi:hypothetical protein QOZ80_1AG0007180 [Eleusine coracana subsp. coracana]|nr:hypothetical protein QOZ80_1AG0007180 [Eleusine coracana subsp. coracana]
MSMFVASHRSSALQTLTVFYVLAVLVADVKGRHHVCHPFSCGVFSNISYPFRRQGDSPRCGPYELVCTATNATIRIGSGTYNILGINHTDPYVLNYYPPGDSFWVVDSKLDMQRSCPLPQWDYHAESDRRIRGELFVPYGLASATFVNCSQEINDFRYKPVRCLSNKDSFIYVLSGLYYTGSAKSFKPSCGYLAQTPLSGPGITVPEDASYEDVVKFMRKGFALLFPLPRNSFRKCLTDSIHTFREEPRSTSGIKQQILDIIAVEFEFCGCIARELRSTNVVTSVLIGIIITFLPYGIWLLKSLHVLCRFVLVPLTIFIFLAHKYWRTRITIDAVEKFLRMQLTLGGPLRYAYTDIIAMTSHFREKLGHGGYGSVYKGVLLPGNLPVAIKMLSNSKCNGEEFISEVSTIGRIHHVNVVRLVGFCSEESQRALVYEYMPNGSLDKYIFSLEKTFSWDKLTEVALGIARGINYLHQGCDMQILHFDIKPHNILLDHNFVPKVADFGLAKLFPRDNSFVPLSAMRGTIGYIAPEMVSRSFGVISSKSDVYSFGMLLLEMAGGRRNADPNFANSSQNYFPSWVYDKLIGQEVGEISIVDMHELEKKLCIVGLWCIQMKSHDRPSMSDVIEMLESDINGLEMPSRPFFCDGVEQISAVDSYYVSSELNDIQEEDE